jgi:hypothetical protein
VGSRAKPAAGHCGKTTLVNFSPKGNTFHKQTNSNTAIPLANYNAVVLFCVASRSLLRESTTGRLLSVQSVLPWLFLAALAAAGGVTIPTVGRLLAPRLPAQIMLADRET